MVRLSLAPILSLILLAPVAPVLAQDASQQSASTLEVVDSAEGWWVWSGRDGTEYRVRLGSVQSHGLQHYDVPQSGVRVVEMTIDTNGSVCARFYYVEPLDSNRIEGPAVEAVERGIEEAGEVTEQITGHNLGDLVIKSYPDTTHSHTMEFRLRSEQEIRILHSSLSRSLEDGVGRTVRPDDNSPGQ